MKTWEMLKELTENPNKRFCSTKNKSDCVSNNCGKVEWIDGNHFYPSWILDEEWEEAPQEVTWQEALEAWANGKDIKSVIYDEEIFYKHEEGYLEDQNGDAISFDELTEGKWYIL